ncbi:MAG TPA: phosphatidylserine/phosphatidylglycerophosphate/cardiolipin synthase family protein [Chloroflexia bacterium]|nr:phosphatidylserine/phosphatidylglycerophosphate/cardiolipin synthase family protein [Chloroflexia bacterium]
MDDIKTIFLCERCQTPEEVADHLSQFLSTATETIDMCVYSFSLLSDVVDVVIEALREREAAGVKIRIAYDAGAKKEVLAEPDYHVPTPVFVTSLGFPCKLVVGNRALMHNKYIIIDADTPQARIWTGSSNFTDDSWSLQENNIVIIDSWALARYYKQDFEELWVDGNIASTGIMDSGEVLLEYGGEPALVRVFFSPLEGELIDQSIAAQLLHTREQITIAAVVVTSSAILNALLDRIEERVPMEGIYDGTQMKGVKYQWRTVPANHWKPGAFEKIVDYGNLVGKSSIPYEPDSPHDFMHNKIMVLDDVVITGSYNFSRHAQRNAENLLMIKSAPLARTYREYIHGLMEKYRNRGQRSGARD